MSFEPDGVSRKEYDRLIAQVVDLTKLRLEDELVHGNVMGRIAVALFGDQNNCTDEECVARAAEIGYELSGAKQRAERAEADLAAARADKDQAYLERNRLVALLSKLFPAGTARTAIDGWSEDWHGCVYIDFPWGQASWHYHDSQAYLFAHLPPYSGSWDGHTTEQKYAAIDAAIAGKDRT